jgi:hypothetical protein
MTQQTLLDCATDDNMKVGALYDILYQGASIFMGFYIKYEDNRFCFFCFDFNCCGDYLYFSPDDIAALEREDTNLSEIARVIYVRCEKIKTLIHLMKWDNSVEFLLARVRKQFE